MHEREVAEYELRISEEFILDVIDLIRNGLEELEIPEELHEHLTLWCDDAEEEYENNQ